MLYKWLDLDLYGVDLVFHQLIFQRNKRTKKGRPPQAIGDQRPFRPFSAFIVTTCRRLVLQVLQARLPLALRVQILIRGQPPFVVAACVATLKREEELQSVIWTAEEGARAEAEAVADRAAFHRHVAEEIQQAWRVTAVATGTVAVR